MDRKRGGHQVGKLSIKRIRVALAFVSVLSIPALADEYPKQPAEEQALVWVSATEVWIQSETPIADTVWETIDVAPVMTKEHKPVYPTDAKKQGLEAEVWVQALVATDGTVHCAKITETSEHGLAPGFEFSALNAAIRNVFHPARKNGKPAATWVKYPVKFRLS